MKYLFEVTILVVMTALLVIKTELFHLDLGASMNMMTLSFTFIVFLVFAFFVWGEQSLDEREQIEKYTVSRYSYLFGTSVLILGIAYQDLVHHMVDIWLVVALGTMVATKIVGRIYFKIRED